MGFSVRVRRRDFTLAARDSRLVLTPTSLAWAALGGPAGATVEVRGPAGAAWDVLNWLRCPVEIYDEHLELVWTGYVAEASVSAGSLTVGASLDDMANRVAIAYSAAGVRGEGGDRATTDWLDDADSQAEYGVRELLSSLPEAATADQATAARAALLALRRLPAPLVRVSGAGQGEAGTLVCRGWWTTLDWRYYKNTAGYVGFEGTGNAQQRFGYGAEVTKVAQQFTVTGSESWRLDRARVRLKRVVQPTDGVRVAVCADSSGAPGAILDAATIAVTDVPESIDWVEVSFATGVTLGAGTYWLVLDRTGATDAQNYYETDAEESLPYTGGVLRLWDGVSWTARATDADLPFAVYGLVAVETLLQRVYAAAGALLAGCEVLATTGQSASPHYEGDRTALDVFKGLLGMGAAGGTRLLAQVNRERWLQVSAEPAQPSGAGSGENVFLASDGRVLTQLGQAWPLATPPAGRWCILRDLAWAERAGASYLAAASPFFIERATYDVPSRRWELEPRAVRSPWEIGGWEAG